MTVQPSVPTSPIELALAEAAALSRARNLETHVLVGADGRYRVIEGDARVAPDETLVAMVGAEGETLMYALRMVA
jgi:hypothetical protein